MALLPHQKALLETIAGPESAGRYNVIYGGRTFTDYSDHPRVAVPISSGPNIGKTSSAAGKYQFLGSTWDSYKTKLGLPDFSPTSQDQAAWALAADTYKQKTGRDLNQVLLSGNDTQIAGVGRVLNGTWTSLPGGIEAGTNTNRFVSAYHKALGSDGVRNNTTTPGKIVDLDGDGTISEAERSAQGATDAGGVEPDGSLTIRPSAGGSGDGAGGVGGSGTVPKAIDRQADLDTAAQDRATQSAAQTAATSLAAWAGLSTDFFGRAVLVILGIVFVAGGVMVFARNSEAGKAIASAVPIAKKLPVAA